MPITSVLRLSLWGVFSILAIAIGLYPIVVWMLPDTEGLLASKPATLLADPVWRVAFYTHISLGGLALLAGVSQFSSRLRTRRRGMHRLLGKIYVVACLVSGVAGLIIAVNATGGLVAQTGFGSLALAWLFTTTKAWLHIRHRRIDDHRRWMIRSYATTFAAVTLRLWMPLFLAGFGMSFEVAYPIIAWLSWVPNLVVAEAIVATRSRS